MSHQKLIYLWVEGPDDERFINKVLRPLFEKLYDSVLIIKYAKMTTQKIKSYLNVIKANSDDYIFFQDMDEFSCISGRKLALLDRLTIIGMDKIIVVVKEIESWYLAGLDGRSSQKLNVPYLQRADNLTKEKFQEFRAKTKFSSEVDFMVEILKFFDMAIAKEKNSSFHYLLKKYKFI